MFGPNVTPQDQGFFPSVATVTLDLLLCHPHLYQPTTTMATATMYNGPRHTSVDWGGGQTTTAMRRQRETEARRQGAPPLRYYAAQASFTAHTRTSRRTGMLWVRCLTLAHPGSELVESPASLAADLSLILVRGLCLSAGQAAPPGANSPMG
jgi:hypothetical protein